MREAVTEVLCAAEAEERDPVDQLLPLIYDELREMAHRHLMHERRDHTINTTDLVHEAYLKLVDPEQVSIHGRTYFFGAAARAMRQVLVDYARRRNRLKRGGDRQRLSLHENHLAADAFAAELIDLDEALDRLAALNPRHARVVECRFFGGLDVEATARILNVSQRTVKNDWALARAWLFRRLTANVE
jgi:RNA polymerase sigma-70 factor, ECF subfamily